MQIHPVCSWRRSHSAGGASLLWYRGRMSVDTRRIHNLAVPRPIHMDGHVVIGDRCANCSPVPERPLCTEDERRACEARRASESTARRDIALARKAFGDSQVAVPADITRRARMTAEKI